MERFRLEFRDEVFFERYVELSDKQIRYYLDLRVAAHIMGFDQQVRQEVQELVRAGEGVIGIEDAHLVMDFELLCNEGFIRRIPSGV